MTPSSENGLLYWRDLDRNNTNSRCLNNGVCRRCGKFPANCGWLSRGLMVAFIARYDHPGRIIPVKYGNWELSWRSGI